MRNWVILYLILSSTSFACIIKTYKQFIIFEKSEMLPKDVIKLSDCSMYPSFEFSVNWKYVVFKESKTSALPPKVKKG